MSPVAKRNALAYDLAAQFGRIGMLDAAKRVVATLTDVEVDEAHRYGDNRYSVFCLVETEAGK